MAKKKKSALKPVARGFATTSVLKKVVPIEEPESEPDALADVADKSTSSAIGGVNGVTVVPVVEEFDPAKAEEQSLQNLVDKLQEKTEREVMRALKGIEFDRRMARSLPTISALSGVGGEAGWVQRVFRLLEEHPPAQPRPQGLAAETEEKVLAKMGITYGTLRRLGFSEERTLECMKEIAGVDLDEALDWLWLHCDEEELSFDTSQDDTKSSASQTPTTAASRFKRAQMPQTPTTNKSLASSSTTDVSVLLSSSTANSTVPSSTASPRMQTQEPTPASLSPDSSGDERADIKSRILAAYTLGTDATSDLDHDPHVEYAKIKLAMRELNEVRKQDGRVGRHGPHGDLMEELRGRLEKVREHYFFRESEGEALYREEKEKADARALEASLKGLAIDSDLSLVLSPTPDKGAKKPATKAMVEPGKPRTSKSPAQTPAELKDSGSESEEGGMFGTMLDEMPTEEITKTGTVVRIRDMALPKQGGARAPKQLLVDAVQKQPHGRHAAIFYYRVGGASRACRAGVRILWVGGSEQVWEMDDEGCYDQTQAENFIATVALHGLAYIPLAGFGASNTIPSVQSSFRLLPATFRDLWDELETKRKDAEDTANRRTWAMLREIAESKMDVWAARTTNKITKEVIAPTDELLSHRFPMGNELNPLQLQAGFFARQMGPAYQEMLIYRNMLPIAPYRTVITETLEQAGILVLSGETGCGKSTQVPSFILEEHLAAGKHCKILVTEPRRISAISLAQRVSNELGDPPGTLGTLASLVGYSIRLESNTTKNTRLTFATNGIALRMLEGGSGHGGRGTAFDDITHIVVDEVHERSIESDFLLIVIKSLLEQGRNIKVVLMSATLDAEKISQFFGGCPMISVPGRTFPVEVGFLEDAVELSGWSIKEGSPYAKRGNDKYARSGKQTKFEWNEDQMVDDDDSDLAAENGTATPAKFEPRYSSSTVSTINLLDERMIPYDLIIRLLERICFEDDAYLPFSNAVLVFMSGLNEIRRLNDMLNEHPLFSIEQAFRIHPLHSLISSEGQLVVFDVPSPGVRKIVISTNIAETGITIPDITCVIDSGRHREMRFDEKRQISKLVECHIAKSNAKQRRGRAGRVQAGLCFHLFTKLRFETQMAEHPLPEMMRLSLSDLALRIKILKVDLGTSIQDVLSRALDPPSPVNIQRAVSALVEVKALTPSEDITPMGRLLSKLPTDVHLGKFLLTAVLFRCLDPALTIAAGLNLKSPFITPFGHEAEADKAKLSFKIGNSDFLTLHNVFSSWRKVCNNPGGSVRTFCRKNYLSYPNLQQIEELRQQFLSYLVDSSFIQVDQAYERELSRARYHRSGKVRFVAVPTVCDENSNNFDIIHAALAAGLYPKLLSIDPNNGSLRTLGNGAPTSIHPTSVNFRTKSYEYGTNYLSYFTLMQSKKLYAWETGPADDVALLLLCGEAEHKFSSNTIYLDKKIKYRLPPRANVALSYLRDHAAAIISLRMRGKEINEEQEQWWELLLDVLGKKDKVI
ncbi:P-loop containing nucleoside triphosphate hydrolase protein [Dacryopinax primogenitus]|uniref:RNA helicase n=1 Tax=Dacryopinax primogenitus (strain DJM 731) TaxID=1858805 RepID=M5G1Z5_DACPD|nr:P-loop containing nucleoside triphosphate hydrolase protein [Dacryopinax primogenitus]EJT99916.1 P-loop containing nucleoside triphosphate hydrolase protein [Dacryopinax primogenitus]